MRINAWSLSNMKNVKILFLILVGLIFYICLLFYLHVNYDRTYSIYKKKIYRDYTSIKRREESLSFGATSDIINLWDYNHLITPNIPSCNLYQTGEPKDFLLVIYSSTDKFEERDMIRTTIGKQWVRKLYKFDLMFVLGINPAASIQKRIKMESNMHQDILVSTFMDEYGNLTRKSVSWVKYVAENCKDIPIVKIDDDVLVNFEYLQQLLLVNKDKIENSYACMYENNLTLPVIRDPKSKWYVPPEMMALEYKTYFEYCSGLAYVTSFNVIKKSYEYLRDYKVHFHNFEDFFLTGKLAAETNVTHVDTYFYYYPLLHNGYYDNTKYAFYLFHNNNVTSYKLWWREVIDSWK